MLQALRLAWPEWLDASQVHEICQILRPDWTKNDCRQRRTTRNLGRLHSYHQVDRIGTGQRLLGRVPGKDIKTGWVRAPHGYRYRLIRRTEDLL